MPINSRQKGARGEREFAEYLRQRGHRARRGQQFAGGPDSPDVKTDLPVHFEVKRVETFNAYKALQQAVEECGDRMPIVAHKRNRKDWVAVLRMDDLMKLVEFAAKRTKGKRPDAGRTVVRRRRVARR